jgi:hypothetical protein
MQLVCLVLIHPPFHLRFTTSSSHARTYPHTFHGLSQLVAAVLLHGLLHGGAIPVALLSCSPSVWRIVCLPSLLFLLSTLITGEGSAPFPFYIRLLLTSCLLTPHPASVQPTSWSALEHTKCTMYKSASEQRAAKNSASRHTGTAVPCHIACLHTTSASRTTPGLFPTHCVHVEMY